MNIYYQVQFYEKDHGHGLGFWPHYNRKGSRLRVNETSQILERYSVQMKTANTQNMTSTQHLIATKGCATAGKFHLEPTVYTTIGYLFWIVLIWYRFQSIYLKFCIEPWFVNENEKKLFDTEQMKMGIFEYIIHH